jgi:hypothetical protein
MGQPLRTGRRNCAAAYHEIRNARNRKVGEKSEKNASGRVAGGVFKLSPANAAWNYTSLYDSSDHSDVGQPFRFLSIDSSGNLFGMPGSTPQITTPDNLLG